MTSQHICLTLALLLVISVTGCYGYGLGVPESACVNMFPFGHWVNASTDPPPFELKVNQTTYSPGDSIEIQLNTKTGTTQPGGQNWVYKGVFVQVRSRDCASPSPLGQFSVQSDEVFLQPIDCLGLVKSAIRHNNFGTFSSRTFYWTAPSAASGHVYVRATVAVSKEKFWMNVFSPLIRDLGDQTSVDNFTPCAVTMLFTLPDRCTNPYEGTGSATPTAATPALLALCVLLLLL